MEIVLVSLMDTLNKYMYQTADAGQPWLLSSQKQLPKKGSQEPGTKLKFKMFNFLSSLLRLSQGEPSCQLLYQDRSSQIFKMLKILEKKEKTNWHYSRTTLCYDLKFASEI